MKFAAVVGVLGLSLLLWVSARFNFQCAIGVEPGVIAVSALQRTAPAPRHVPFEVGETLTYNVSWKIFDAGIATMTLAEKFRFQNEEVYKVTATARSTGILSTLFKVMDIFESHFQAREICSRRLSKSIREGSRQRDSLLVFDPKTRQAKLEEKDLNRPDLPPKHSESPIPLCVQDVLSALYIIRTKNLKVGEQFIFPINDGGKTYDVGVEVQAAEEIKTPAGMFQTLRLEPRVFDGLFKNKGRMFLWITNDDEKMPIQLKAKINIGTITAALSKVSKAPALRVPRPGAQAELQSVQ